MKKRRYHTSMNLLLEPDMYQRIKMISTLERIPMSELIREGIKLKIDEIDKKNNAVITEKKQRKEEDADPLVSSRTPQP